jgi:3-hydroxybutyryl-CoA dehydrogenase
MMLVCLRRSRDALDGAREVPNTPNIFGMKTIGIVGAGVMGAGLAQAVAQSGLDVLLIDLSSGILESALGTIRRNLRFQPLFQKDLAIDPEEMLKRITPSSNYQVLEAADFIIENVTEKVEIKEAVYRQLDRICGPHCVLAANSSTIPVTRIASFTSRPAMVIGLHFMNPVPLKTAVEVARGYHTSQECFDAAMSLLEAMGKQSIVVNDAPGFVSNRVLMLAINEAIFLLQERVASAETIDSLFKTCLGHKMGPLETADLIGLDTILFSIENLFREFSDSKFRPCPLLGQMVAAGLYGCKTGRGFYNYGD